MEDVIVIGAGPAGSHISGLLAKKGHRVKVLEEHIRPGDRVCCSGIIGTDCLRMLPAAIPTIRSANSATFVSPQEKRVRVEKESPQAYILDRSVLDLSLAREAESYGVEFVLGCTAENATIANGHVEIRARMHDRDYSFQSRCIVLASGFNPGLSSRLGLGNVADFALGAQTEVEVHDAEEVEIWFSSRLSPGFFAWIVPTTQGQALVGLMCRRAPGKNLRKFLQHLSLRSRIKNTETPLQFGVVPLKPLHRSYGDRIIAVGDAAGQVKPTTGGGIYYGLICGEIGADVLDGALRRDDLSIRRLSEYEKRWRKVLGNELRIGYISRRRFERLGDNAIESLFDIVRTHSLDRMVSDSRGISFDWHGPILRWALGHPGVSSVFGATFMGLSLPGLIRRPPWKSRPVHRTEFPGEHAVSW